MNTRRGFLSGLIATVTGLLVQPFTGKAAAVQTGTKCTNRFLCVAGGAITVKGEYHQLNHPLVGMACLSLPANRLAPMRDLGLKGPQLSVIPINAQLLYGTVDEIAAHFKTGLTAAHELMTQNSGENSGESYAQSQVEPLKQSMAAHGIEGFAVLPDLSEADRAAMDAMENSGFKFTQTEAERLLLQRLLFAWSWQARGLTGGCSLKIVNRLIDRLSVWRDDLQKREVAEAAEIPAAL